MSPILSPFFQTALQLLEVICIFFLDSYAYFNCYSKSVTKCFKKASMHTDDPQLENSYTIATKLEVPGDVKR